MLAWRVVWRATRPLRWRRPWSSAGWACCWPCTLRGCSAPPAVGAYNVAQNVWHFASICADFGLGTLLTRDVARDRPAAAQRTAATVGLRLVLAAACAPAAALVAVLYGDRAILITVVLLAAGLFPAAIAGALSAVFAGHERMTTPAAVQLFGGVLTAALGFAVLAVGWGIIGLGGVSLAVSLLTAVVFIRLVRRRYFAPRIALTPRPARAAARGLAADAQ